MYKRLTDELAAHLVEAACAAPSIHNSQPWQFEAAAAELRLCGAANRALWVADPDARALYISCGAALFNAVLAARQLGLDSEVSRLPHPKDPLDVLAVIKLTEGRVPAPGESRLYRAIWQRHTNRGPYSTTRIPPLLMAGLQKSAAAQDATLRMLDRRDADTVLDLSAWASRELAADYDHQVELRRWLDGTDDGIPAWALPARPRHLPAPVRDADFLAAAQTGRVRARYERHPQLAVLATKHDEPHDWLRAGEALQHVLLTATANGLSASFLYQVIERDDMLGDDFRDWPWQEHPQMVIRLGYGLPALATPRRSLEDAMWPTDRLQLAH